MEKEELNLKIEVFDIDVSRDYFSFKYNYYVNGEMKEGYYESDWCNGMTVSDWKEMLQGGGEALRLALQDIAGDF